MTYDEYTIDNIQFGDLSAEILAEMFTDGRLASHFLERQLCEWYPWLKFVDQKGYDHISAAGRKYDQKCFTKGGLTFSPSNMTGKGRSFNEEVAHEHAKDIVYICCDIVDFPTVRVKFSKGSDLIKKFPKCKIPFSKREAFFNDTEA